MPQGSPDINTTSYNILLILAADTGKCLLIYSPRRGSWRQTWGTLYNYNNLLTPSWWLVSTYPQISNFPLTLIKFLSKSFIVSGYLKSVLSASSHWNESCSARCGESVGGVCTLAACLVRLSVACVLSSETNHNHHVAKSQHDAHTSSCLMILYTPCELSAGHHETSLPSLFQQNAATLPITLLAECQLSCGLFLIRCIVDVNHVNVYSIIIYVCLYGPL